MTHSSLMPFTPMLLVDNVEASSAWLRKVLPLRSLHGGPQFEMLGDEGGETIAWLHAVETDHAHLQLANMRVGNLTGGTIQYLKVTDKETVLAIYKNAQHMQANILEEPHTNPLARFFEFTFEDPNGYRFAVHSPFSSE